METLNKVVISLGSLFGSIVFVEKFMEGIIGIIFLIPFVFFTLYTVLKSVGLVNK